MILGYWTARIVGKTLVSLREWKLAIKLEVDRGVSYIAVVEPICFHLETYDCGCVMLCFVVYSGECREVCSAIKIWGKCKKLCEVRRLTLFRLAKSARGGGV